MLKVKCSKSGNSSNVGLFTKTHVNFALAGVAQLERCPLHQKVVGRIPGWGLYRRQPNNVALSGVRALSFPLSRINEIEI